MKSIEQIRSILESNREELRKTYKVSRLGVFGSVVKGRQRQSSDIDVLVEFEEPVGLFQFMDLEEHLGELLGAKVDLVSRKALKPYIGENILREVLYV